MGIRFSCRGLVSLCAFVGCMHITQLSYSQAQSEPPVPSQKEEKGPTYSKAGSDSISLIVFGRILVKTTPTSKATTQGTPTPASKYNDKNIKKEKFTIKPSDKLKPNNALY